ncbi:uncharacterized protein LOC135501084 [Lineus longissimus]|uniref:uncharacterized protein LOC135501084 n=1 Tax=Lineus longissimus TaxID=88925 RepID=UPI00315D9876
MSDNIKVAVRVRPLLKSKREVTTCWKFLNESSISQCDPNTRRPVGNPYTFDEIFDQKSSTFDVFNTTALPIVDSFINGINGTIFAYGQTASGKTFTISGTPEQPGLIPLCVDHLFNSIENNMDNMEFLVRVSYIELYNEKFSDLLDTTDKSLKIRERPDENQMSFVYIDGVSEEMIQDRSQILELLNLGNKRRRTGETLANRDSSRSHSIFKIILESRERTNEEDDGIVRVSHLNLVDLAGSERISLTGATGERFKEGCHINLSLSALTSVINKLGTLTPDQKNTVHIPFRDSKLTRILQSALGGNSKTAIICAISPASADIEFSTSTLKFATNAKRIENKPVVNEIMSEEALLKRYKKKIAVLEKELEKQGNPDIDNIRSEKEDLQKQLLEKEAKEREQEEKIRELRSMILTNPSSVEVSKKMKKSFKRRETWCPGQLKKAGLMLPPSTVPDFVMPSSVPRKPAQQKVKQRRSIYDRPSPPPKRLYVESDDSGDFKSSESFLEEVNSLPYEGQCVPTGPVTQRKKPHVMFETPEQEEKLSYSRKVEELQRVIEIYKQIIYRLGVEEETQRSRAEAFEEQEWAQLEMSLSPDSPPPSVVNMSMTAGIHNISLTAEMQIAELEALREEVKNVRQLENEIAERRYLEEENEILRPLVDRVEKLSKLESEVTMLREIKKDYDSIQKTNCEAEIMAQIAQTKLERVTNEKELCEEKIREYEAAAEALGDCGHTGLVAELEAARSNLDAERLARNDLESEQQARLAEVEKFESEVGELRAQLAERQAEFEAVKTDLDAERQARSNLELAKLSEVEKFEAELVDLRSQLAEQHKRFDLGEKELQNCLAAAQSALEEEKKSHEMEVQDLQARIAPMEAELLVLNEKVSALQESESASSGTFQELANVIKKVTYLEEQICELRDEKKGLEDQLEELTGECERSCKAKEDAENLLATTEELAKNLKCEMTMYKENSEQEKESFRGELKQVMEDLTRDKEAAERVASSRLSEIEELNQVLETLIFEKHALESATEEMKEELLKLEERRAELEGLHESLVKQVVALEGDNLVLEGRVEVCDLAVAALENGALEHSERVLCIEKQVALLKSEKSELEKQIEELVTGVAEEKDAVVDAEVSTELTFLKEQVQLLESEKEELKKQLEDVITGVSKSCGSVLEGKLRNSLQERVQCSDLEKAELQAQVEKSVSSVSEACDEDAEKIATLENKLLVLEDEKVELEKQVEDLIVGVAPPKPAVHLESVVSTLENQIKDLMSEKADLEQQVEDLITGVPEISSEQELDELKQIVASLKSEKIAANRLIEERQSELDEVNQVLETLICEKESLESSLEEQTLEIEEVKQALETMKLGKETAESVVQEREAEIDQLEKWMKESENSVEDWKRKVQDNELAAAKEHQELRELCTLYQGEKESMEMQLEENKNVVIELEGRVNELEKVVESVKEELEVSERCLRALKVECETSAKEKEKAEQLLSESEDHLKMEVLRCEELKTEVRRISGVFTCSVNPSEAAEFERQLAEQTSMVAELECRLAEQTTVADQILAEHNRELAELQQRLAEQTTEAEQLRETLMSVEAEREETSEQLAVFMKEKENLSSALETIKTEAEMKLSELHSDVTQLEEKVRKSDATSEMLQQDLDERIATNAELSNRLEFRDFELERLRVDMDDMMAMNADITHDETAMMQNLQEKSATVQELQGVLHDGKQKFESLQNTCKELRQQLEEASTKKEQMRKMLLKRQKQKSSETVESAISYEELLEKNQRMAADLKDKYEFIERLNENYDRVDAEYLEKNKELEVEKKITAELRQQLKQLETGPNSTPTDGAYQEMVMQLTAEKKLTKKLNDHLITKQAVVQGLLDTQEQMDGEIKEIEGELTDEKKRVAKLEEKLKGAMSTASGGDDQRWAKLSREVEEKKMEVGVLKVRLEKAEMDYERRLDLKDREVKYQESIVAEMKRDLRKYSNQCNDTIVVSEPQKSAQRPVPTMGAVGGSGIIDSVNNMMLAAENRSLKDELKSIKREFVKVKKDMEAKAPKVSEPVKECPKCVKQAKPHSDSGPRLPLKDVAPLNTKKEEAEEEDPYGGNWAEKFAANRRKQLGIPEDDDDPPECTTS